MNASFVNYYANSLMLAGHPVDAERTFQHALTLDSGIVRSPTARQVMLDLGKYEDVARLGEKYKIPWGEVVYALMKLGRKAQGDSVLREVRSHQQKSLSDQVIASLAVGDTASALNTLDGEKGPNPRQPARSLSDPLFDPIRTSPRFAAYVQRIGLNPKILAAGKGGRP